MYISDYKQWPSQCCRMVLRRGSLPAATGTFSGLAFKSLVGSNLVTHSLSEKPSCKNLKSQSSSFFDTAHNSAV